MRRSFDGYGLGAFKLTDAFNGHSSLRSLDLSPFLTTWLGSLSLFLGCYHTEHYHLTEIGQESC